MTKLNERQKMAAFAGWIKGESTARISRKLNLLPMDVHQYLTYATCANKAHGIGAPR